MEIIHIINALPQIGGAERLVLDIARAQKHQRSKVITWLNADTSLCDVYIDDALYVLPLRPFKFSKFLKAIRWIYNSDLLHVHLFPSLYFAALLPRPKIFTEHNTWTRRRRYKFFQTLDRLTYKKYNHVVAISEATKSSLSNWLSPLCVPITVVENGIFLDRFNGFVRFLKKEPNSILIGMAGSFTSQKDQDTLVRALSNLPWTIQLLFAGTGPRRREIELLAQELGVIDQVTFLGNVVDMPDFYKKLDIYVQSSHWEGFGLTAVEAMASGLPCVAANVPGLAEVVGDRGHLFTRGDAHGLASIIKTLIDSPFQYQKSSIYSLERANSFSIYRMITAYNQIYQSILSGSPPNK